MIAALLGDTPKLLLRASPIVYVGPDRHRRGWIGLIEQVHHDGRARIAWNAGVHSVERLEHVVLDLTDATGRAHAAWWAVLNGWGPAHTVNAEDIAVVKCERGESVTPTQIDTLARLCLRLAGRSHV